MRILKELQVDPFKITVFFWNDKYLLKFENGTSEITYKIKQLDVTSETDIDVFLHDPAILEKTRHAFAAMDEALDAFFANI